jgi:lipopolysaccharide transport system ATP-binding protein
MTDTVIRVENLGKKYVIDHQKQERYSTLRDAMANRARALAQKPLQYLAQRRTASPQEEFWALKDVSFEIKQGDRVGIIGRNGAGKSTLLKILSRITEPTTGRICINGRVASLLEVGTGFHPELTGRENIYLNGAILGMSKVEIKRKFDEIVDFAEVEKFLDTPVKRYSSGMYVRLAFAVAAHLEPEVLIVDEVLAVGDVQFQKKCLGKMEEVGKEGRTVLFVSHQMAAIENLCQRAVLLEQGRSIADDKTKIVISKYLERLLGKSYTSLTERTDRKGTGDLQFISVSFQNKQGIGISSLYSGGFVKFIFSYKNNVRKDLRSLHLSVGVNNQMGERIAIFSNNIVGENFLFVPLSTNKVTITVNKLPLMPGRYGLTIYCTINGVVADWIQNAVFFEVEQGDFFNTGKLPPIGQGIFLVDHSFSLE